MAEAIRQSALQIKEGKLLKSISEIIGVLLGPAGVYIIFWAFLARDFWSFLTLGLYAVTCILLIYFEKIGKQENQEFRAKHIITASLQGIFVAALPAIFLWALFIQDYVSMSTVMLGMFLLIPGILILWPSIKKIINPE